VRTPSSEELRFAVGTLTRLPVAPPTRVDPDIAGRGLALGPLVGAGLGLVSGLPVLLMGPDLLTRLLSATLAVALAAWLTRGLHWDGLADLADGLASGAPADRALVIMRRPDIGPFGALTMGLVAAVQVISLARLPSGAPALGGWILAVALGRLAVAVGSGWWLRPARTDGLGAGVVGSVTPSRLALAGALTAVVCVVEAATGQVGWADALLWAPLAAVLVALALGRVAQRRLGGSTGDVLGASAELATAAALLAMTLL